MHFIHFERWFCPGPGPESVTFSTDDSSWEHLVAVLRSLSPKDWSARYHDTDVLDGGGWRLKAKLCKLVIRSEGLNAAPPGFDKFLLALAVAVEADAKVWTQHPHGMEGKTRPQGLLK